MNIRGLLQRRFSCHHGLGEWFVRRVARKLRLSEDQRSQLSILRDIVVSKRRQMRGIHRDHQDEISALLTGIRLDRDKAAELLQVPLQAINDCGQAIIEAFGNFYDSLDGDQQVRLRRYFEQRRRCHAC